MAESEYGAKIQAAIDAGSRRGLELRAKREAAGKKVSEGGMTGSLPKILDAQLTQKYGGDYHEDTELMRDLRERHPEMMAIDGDRMGDAADGLHTKRGRVTMKWVKGQWYRHENGQWVPFQPPSKMNWADRTPPMMIK